MLLLYQFYPAAIFMFRWLLISETFNDCSPRHTSVDFAESVWFCSQWMLLFTFTVTTWDWEQHNFPNEFFTADGMRIKIIEDRTMRGYIILITTMTKTLDFFIMIVAISDDVECPHAWWSFCECDYSFKKLFWLSRVFDQILGKFACLVTQKENS